MTAPDPRVWVAERRALADKATEGPWFREYGDVVSVHDDPRDVRDGFDEPRRARVVQRAGHRALRDPQALADAAFIVTARTYFPRALDALQAALDECDAIDALAAQLDRSNPGAFAERAGWDGAVMRVRAAITASLEVAP